MRSRAVVSLARTVVRPTLGVLPLNSTVMASASLIDRAAGLLPRPRDCEYHRVSLGACEAEIVSPRGVQGSSGGALLYLHGGGFVAGGLNTHRRMIALLAGCARLPVMHVGYRKLPHATIRDSVSDCVSGYRWLLEHDVPADRIVVAGESAGGFLAFATAIAARDKGMPLPSGLVGISPWLDLDCATKRAASGAQTEALLPISVFEAVARLGGEVDGELDAALSPANADVTGLPPVLLVALRSEVLRTDIEAMAARLGDARVSCVLHLWRGQIHGFSALFPASAEGREMLCDVGEFVRARIGAQPAWRMRIPTTSSVQ
ncbi:alpha/beta hydrolase [Hoyosella sp. YIM 151337]|uniref:alpha/beta hydrolase n=1 Tax=Hoyosella sp. YIM 151337 TaxID=2992742 RepID=UPI0022356509|nr:alpha/beta hydrolase [Hoyosella sp. YIM 151337]MCW4354880.1 alpha/beta hydrolase [Hoyosella sp. YIM 151337]